MQNKKILLKFLRTKAKKYQEESRMPHENRSSRNLFIFPVKLSFL